MQTTAGSHALVGSVVPRDAHVVYRLRKAGAIILAKANLAEWSNYRGHKPGMANGWSGRGGQCTNAYLQNGDPGGSSSGSGVCASIGLAAGALGTETNGSIVSPSQRSNIVGIKPTVGLTSRNGVIPISEHEDTVGPMCRCVADAAILLQAIVGPDERDPYTADQPVPPPDYTEALQPEGLRGVRIGVPRKAFAGEAWLKEWPDILPAFEQALNILRELGAEVVDPVDYEITADVRKRTHETVVMAVEMKDGVNRYLSELVEVPTGVRTLADVLAFNDAHPELEKPPGYHDQSRMQEAENTQGFDEKYLDALQHCKELSAHSLILKSLKTDNLRALVYPSNSSAIIYSAALAGFPHITVPLGFMSDDTPDLPSQHPKLTGPGLPFGIGFTGKAYSEYELISYAYAFEQATNHRSRRKPYAAATPQTQLNHVRKDGNALH
ncbi:amidase signature enzyme [Sistotremastrum niveocremeum HHB9708]|uniref:Amidase signature enzyme n=1 Tax=Sistotremastrum niveocremeum HHB9708 TaxID=1314777 RepID=A0A165ABS6_9AGAM|nr:amidase signature enzyme [Sistotremastrum niveocremeum HHB9708]